MLKAQKPVSKAFPNQLLCGKFVSRNDEYRILCRLQKKKHLKQLLTILFLIVVNCIYAQQANRYVQKGNDSYTKSVFTEALDYYKQALALDAENSAALYNSGNALHKLGKDAEAEQYYEKFSNTVDRDIKAKAFYNKGVVQAYQHKLPEAVESFKQALLLNPEDNDSRENLQKALNELKKQQQATSPQIDKQQPKQDKSKTKQPSQEMIDQKFNELRDKERQLQKMLRKSSNAKNPEKDW